MKALIFAAGLGTRLKPITDTLPKALVPVCGKPLLWHVVEKLKKSGVTEFVINIHHFADKIREYVAANDSFGVKVSFSDETDLLRETGGGIRHAAPLLAAASVQDEATSVQDAATSVSAASVQASVSAADEPFLVHNVDILSNLDIEKFVGAHKKSIATLLVSDRKTQRYLLFNDDGNLAGWMNIQTGEVKSPYPELRRSAEEVAIFGGASASGAADFNYELFLSKNNLKKYAFDGAHLISPQIFKLMEQMPEKFSIIDFYLEICSQHNINYYIQPDLQMIDVGKLDTLHKAEEFLQG